MKPTIDSITTDYTLNRTFNMQYATNLTRVCAHCVHTCVSHIICFHNCLFAVVVVVVARCYVLIYVCIVRASEQASAIMRAGRRTDGFEHTHFLMLTRSLTQHDRRSNAYRTQTVCAQHIKSNKEIETYIYSMFCWMINSWQA